MEERIFAVGETAYTTPDEGNPGVYQVKVIAQVPDPDGELEMYYAIKIYTPVDDYIDIRQWRRLWKTADDAREHFAEKERRNQAARLLGRQMRGEKV